jgi:hypothetical protein
MQFPIWEGKLTVSPSDDKRDLGRRAGHKQAANCRARSSGSVNRNQTSAAISGRFRF